MADGVPRRASALAAEGIDPPTVARALRAGTIERVSRGTYRSAGDRPPADVDLAAACLRMPRAVVWMLSAAHLHALVEAVRPALWLAVPGGSSVTSVDHAAVRVLHWKYTGAFEVGVAERRVCGIEMRITDRARTVVDLLRYSRHVGGKDVGLAAARQFLASDGEHAELRRVATAVGAPATVHCVLGILGAFQDRPT